MPSTADFTALDRLLARVHRIAAFDATPLMKSWMDIIRADNQRGVLAGLDKDGVPLAPVTYRPKGGTLGTFAFQRNQRKASQRGIFAGLGKHAAGLNNNLSSSEYRHLDGPPLAPRGRYSRVITNLVTGWIGRPGDTHWEAIGAWDEVVSPTGFAFLPVHFQGLPLGKNGPRIRRDLCGVRPEGRQEARDALVAWASDLVREHG